MPTAWTDAWGDNLPHYITNAGNATWVPYNGSEGSSFSYLLYIMDGQCTRRYKSSNPIQMIGSTKWRKSSLYERNVTSWGGFTVGTFRQYHSDGYWESKSLIQDTGYFATTASFPPYLGQTSIDGDVALYNAAAVKCLSNLADGKANLSESLATAVQTINMIANTSTTLVSALIAAKRGRWRECLDILGLPSYIKGTESAASSYLAWKFGWSPLMGDIYAAKNLLAKAMSGALILKATGSAERSISGEADYNGYLQKKKLNMRHIVVCHATVDDAALRAASQVGLTNPAQLAWELLPWSFVIDWFLPIGSLIEGIGGLASLNFLSGSHTMVYSLTGSASQSDLLWWQITDPPSCTFERKHVLRLPTPGFPMPSSLEWKDPFTNSHVLTATALIRQLMRVS